MKHDKGPNATICGLDTTVWVMLLNFPLDCRHPRVIDRDVLGFGDLVRIHDSSSKASVVAKVWFHDNAKVLDDVLVSVGDDPASRSSNVLVVRLAMDWVLPVVDEMPPPEGQFPHPLPLSSSPRWMGAHGP